MQIHQGNNLEVLKTFESNSIDSVVTDSPYGLKFMGKKWDHTVPSVEFWREIYRVLKPGGHVLSFGGTRTYHRMAVNIEDAGFEIRDQLQWLYGSGFPKSHNVSKAIDKKFGVEREVIGKKSTYRKPQSPNGWDCTSRAEFETAPGHDLAKKWDGFGTALKPANEPIVLARKPLEGTVVDNVLKWGVGCLNIDGCRIATDDELGRQQYKKTSSYKCSNYQDQFFEGNPQGRFPANILLDEQAAELLDEQSGVSRSVRSKRGGKNGSENNVYGDFKTSEHYECGFQDKGGASRFFYVAKASKKERNAGLEGMPEKLVEIGDERPSGNSWERRDKRQTTPRANFHPTVKPIKLMRYLARLVTPPGGKVLDPFMGSGTTGVASIEEGFDFVGIELNQEYYDIARKRLDFSVDQQHSESNIL